MCKATAKNEIQQVGIETISVKSSNSQIYSDLLAFTPATREEEKFLKDLKKAIEARVKPFKVPRCDPSIDGNGRLQFVAGCEPAVEYSYNDVEKLATENGVKLGSKNQYVLFLAMIIYRLIKEGWSESDAWYAVCTDSNRLGHFRTSENAKKYFEPTGSREIVGKCDLGNTRKILAYDEEVDGYWVAGGVFIDFGEYKPLAYLVRGRNYVFPNFESVGWFVL